MLEHLFTYGSLQPGREYAHLLQTANGLWQPATVTGFVDANGWQHSIGYPALILHEDGQTIQGMLLSSDRLHELWSMLDEFEGDAYERVTGEVTTRFGEIIHANLYQLHRRLQTAVKTTTAK